MKRLFDLGSMWSADSRFSNAAGDIWQHRIRNCDWDGEWISHNASYKEMAQKDEYPVGNK